MGSSCSTIKRKVKKRTRTIRHNMHLRPKRQVSFINKADGFSWFYGGEQQFFIVKIGKKKHVQKYYHENKDNLIPLSMADKKIVIGKRRMRTVASELIKNANNNPYYIDVTQYQQLSRWHLFLIFLRCGLHRFGDFYSILRPCRFSYSITAPENSNGSDLELRIIHGGVNLRQDMTSKHYMLAEGKPVLLSGEMFIYFEKECVPKIQELIKTNKNIEINMDDNDLYSILPYCKLILDNESATYQPTNDFNRFHHIEQLLKNSFLDDDDHNNKKVRQEKFHQIKLEILDRTSEKLKQYKTDMQINFNAIV